MWMIANSITSQNLTWKKTLYTTHVFKKKRLYIYNHYEQICFFDWLYITRKWNKKFKKTYFGGFQWPKVRGGGEKTKGRNCQMFICDFHCVAKDIEGWLKICSLILIYSQIWLNPPRDNRHFFYIFQISGFFHFQLSAIFKLYRNTLSSRWTGDHAQEEWAKFG
jgi:hypothetical protein